MVASGKMITAAGISAGIDMALTLAAALRGPEAAQVAQLWIEYDPRPPFDAGHMSKASVSVRRAARAYARREGANVRSALALPAIIGDRMRRALARRFDP